MANIATQTTILTNARAVGSKNPKTGVQHGGIYYPAHTKNGKNVSARWEGNVALNGKPFFNANGEKVEGRTTFMRLVVWNGKNAAAGKGLADTFAKCVSVGKEISCNVRIESFDKRIFINGQPIVNPATGNVLTTQSHNFIFEDKLVFGDDSNKVIAGEITRWNGSATFDSRPKFWNTVGHADQIAWSQTIVPARMASTYKGGDVYGYARVIIPEGVQLAGQAPINQAAINTGTPPTEAANMLNQPAQTATPMNQPAQTAAPINQPAQTATVAVDANSTPL